jgi:hypothetical protein
MVKSLLSPQEGIGGFYGLGHWIWSGNSCSCGILQLEESYREQYTDRLDSYRFENSAFARSPIPLIL